MSIIVETIVIELDNISRKYTVVSNRGLISEALGTIKIQDDGFYCADSLNYDYGPVEWQSFQRALAFLISPRGMT